MAFKIEVEYQVENLEETRRNLPYLLDLWRIITAEELRGWGRQLKAIAFKRSPSDKLRGIDPRRRPESASFKHQWQWQISRDGTDPVLEVGNIDERMKYIVFPTEPRNNPIRPRGTKPLAFFKAVAEGGKHGPFFSWTVNRKETPGQPVHLWALEEFNVDSHIPGLANRLVSRRTL